MTNDEYPESNVPAPQQELPVEASESPDDFVGPVRPIENWTVGQWGGQPKYSCNSCPWDTLDLDRMIEHQESAHPPIVEPAPIVPQET
jgi:hypothetical protein